MNSLASEIVNLAIDDINNCQDGVNVIEKSMETLLLSDGSTVDSLTLVRLLVNIEQLIEDKIQRSVGLIDESVYEEGYSPFSTVGTLVLHVEKILAN